MNQDDLKKFGEFLLNQVSNGGVAEPVVAIQPAAPRSIRVHIPKGRAVNAASRRDKRFEYREQLHQLLTSVLGCEPIYFYDSNTTWTKQGGYSNWNKAFTVCTRSQAKWLGLTTGRKGLFYSVGNSGQYYLQRDLKPVEGSRE